MTTPNMENTIARYSKQPSFSPRNRKLSAVAAIGWVKLSTIASENGNRNIAKNMQITLIYPKMQRKSRVVATSRGTSNTSYLYTLQNKKLPTAIPNDRQKVT